MGTNKLVSFQRCCNMFNGIAVSVLLPHNFPLTVELNGVLASGICRKSNSILNQLSNFERRFCSKKDAT